MALSNPKLLQTALPFIALFLVLLPNKVHSENTISFTVNSFTPDAALLTYQGDAHVPSGSSLLRLTKTDASGTIPGTWSVGRVLFSNPIQLWKRAPAKEASWETTIRFIITPSPNGAADGIVFFIAPVNPIIPSDSAGENFGVFGKSGTSSALFAVEFDTYYNAGWDPRYRHIGIDVNSRNSRSTATFGDAALGQVVTARITYEAYSRKVSIVASTISQTYVLDDVFDLRRVMPEQVQVGISSSTGMYVNELGIHDILSWNFTSTW